MSLNHNPTKEKPDKQIKQKMETKVKRKKYIGAIFFPPQFCSRNKIIFEVYEEEEG